MTAPLSTRACSSLVSVSGLPAAGDIRRSVVTSNSIEFCLPVLTASFLIKIIRAANRFLSDYLTPDAQDRERRPSRSPFCPSQEDGRWKFQEKMVVKPRDSRFH